MRLHPSKNQRWRVSVYKTSTDDKATFPIKHTASRSFEIAKNIFEQYASKIKTGEVGRVILHQGKLYTGYNAYVEIDTNWFPYRYLDA